MNKQEVKILIRGIFFFLIVCFFCLKTHLRRFPEILQARCIDQIEALGGKCSSISVDGRDVRVSGIVPRAEIIDTLVSSLICLPGVHQMHADMHVSEDSFKIMAMQSLSQHQVFFDKNSSDLPQGSIDFLDSLADFINNYPRMYLVIRGYTDIQGSFQDNQLLSEKRAENIRFHLLQKNCDSTRLQAIGLGELLADSLVLEDSLARRVDFILKESVP